MQSFPMAQFSLIITNLTNPSFIVLTLRVLPELLELKKKVRFLKYNSGLIHVSWGRKK